MGVQAVGAERALLPALILRLCRRLCLRLEEKMTSVLLFLMSERIYSNTTPLFDSLSCDDDAQRLDRLQYC